MINHGMFLRERKDWETPPKIFDWLNAKWGFLLDVAASPENAKCARFYTREDNGLVLPWAAVNWCNPPYGNEISDWVKKADEEAEKGNITVMLIPARTDTKWFHDHCAKYRIEFIRGRIKFVGAPHTAPFPSMLVYFQKESEQEEKNMKGIES